MDIFAVNTIISQQMQEIYCILKTDLIYSMP